MYVTRLLVKTNAHKTWVNKPLFKKHWKDIGTVNPETVPILLPGTTRSLTSKMMVK